MAKRVVFLTSIYEYNKLFILLLAVLFFGGCENADSQKLFQIGVIMHGKIYEKIIDGLKQEIESGELKGRVTLYIQDFPKTADEFGSACQILSTLKPDLIYAVTTQAALSSKKNFKETPIIFNAVGDPIGAGIVKSLRTPGENITGFSNFSKELTSKRLEIFKDTFLSIKNVLTAYNPQNPYSMSAIGDLRKAALSLKINLIEITGDSTNVIRSKLHNVKKKEVDGIYIIPDTIALFMFSEFVQLSKQFKIPIMAHESSLAEKGAAVSYGADFFELGKLSYVYVKAILNGESVSNLPVFFPDNFTLTVNKKTLDSLELKPSKKTLFFADRLIND